MESLDNHWILQDNEQQCEQLEKAPNTLGLKNMAGVFIVVGVGIIGGIGLIIIEVAYKKHQNRKQKKMELARHAADKWRGAIEVTTMLNKRRSPCIGIDLFSFDVFRRPFLRILCLSVNPRQPGRSRRATQGILTDLVTIQKRPSQFVKQTQTLYRLKQKDLHALQAIVN